MNIKFTDIEHSDLYLKYPGQIYAQPAFFEIDCRGDDAIIDFGINPEVGNAIPMDEWNGRLMRFKISNYISRQGMEEIYADETVRSLVQQIVDGYSKDIRNGNRIGVLTPDARGAASKLAEYLANEPWTCFEDDELFDLVEGEGEDAEEVTR